MSERQKIKRKLDQWVSWYVRKRDKHCVICGLPTEYNDQELPISNHCGHFLGRKRDTTRWDLRNCNCQCPSCNWKHNDNFIPYHEYMIATYGTTVIEELNIKYQNQGKITIPELKELLVEIKGLYEELI